MLPKNEEERQRDAKYSEFVQHEPREMWQRLVLYLFAPLVPFRIISSFALCISLCLYSYFLKLFLDPESMTYYRLVKLHFTLNAYLLSFLCSILWTFFERPKICYKKWLGPDWEPKYEGASTAINNHISYMDQVQMALWYLPGFVSGEHVLHMPVIGECTKAAGSIYLNREDKAQASNMYAKIKAKQEKAEAGLGPPLLMCPEGGTTNGSKIIKFKKGAFASMMSVHPIGIKYTSFVTPIEVAMIPMFEHAILLLANPIAYSTHTEFPVFKPNKFFMDNHVKEGEDPGEAYARVMRTIMAEQMKCNTSEVTINNKFEFKAIMFPKKEKKEA